MEIFQIRYALAVARHLSFTRAAAECNVSQPAMSKAVKALEAELGGALFHREGKRIVVSAFAQSLLPRLQDILDQAEATRSLANSLRLLKKAPLRLGVMSTIGHVRLARFLAHFERTHQLVELAVSEDGVQGLLAKLDSGELDAAILNPLDRASENVSLVHLYSERYVVIFPTDHRLAKLDTIPLAELSGEGYVDRLACEMRERVMQVCQQSNIELYARFRSDREDWIQAMVLAGIGFAFAPEYSVTLPGLLQRPLVEPAVERNVYLATVRGRPFPPAVDAFVRAARAFAWPG